MEIVMVSKEFKYETWLKPLLRICGDSCLVTDVSTIWTGHFLLAQFNTEVTLQLFLTTSQVLSQTVRFH